MATNLFEVKKDKKEDPGQVKQLRLLRLSMLNFKGIKKLDLQADGEDLTIWGQNATGKTSCADAYHFLLFGKDSKSRSDFEIKTLGPDGEPVHGLTHGVEAVIELDGQRITLQREYSENWTKKRGSAHKQFTGHSTTYKVDGVPVTASEYQATISEIADEETWRLLTDPTYFSEQLHWQQRRQVLLEVCGDVSDEEVIASNKELSELPEILGGRSLEDHRKVITSRRQAINKELPHFATRIDEVTRSLPDVSELDLKKAEKELADLREKREEAEAERSRIQSGGQIAEKKRELAEISARLMQLEMQARRSVDDVRSDAEDRLRTARIELNTARDDLQTLNRRRESAQKEIEALTVQIEDLRSKWYEVDHEQLEFTGETVCHACGQDLPEERIEEAHRKALEAFNDSKSKRLTEISEQGRQKASEKEALEASVEMLDGQIRAAEAKIEELSCKFEQERKRLSSLSDEIRFPKKHSELVVRRDRIQKEIDELHANAQPAYERAGEQIQELEDQIADIERKLQSVEQRRNGEKRIEELLAQEKELASEFERLEYELHLCEQFVRSKVSLLEEKINSNFELARFKLFAEQINGGLSEVCETSYLGVPWRSLNHGAKVNVGLDIIRTLQRHYHFSPPAWVDQCESVTRLIDMDCQTIRLVVSEADKELRVERTA